MSILNNNAVPEIKYRNELKYHVGAGAFEEIGCRLTGLLSKDPHGGKSGSYTVTSLYFDTFDNACCFENDAGVSQRSKYRIRMYNREPSPLRLEKKSKNNTLCAKASAVISPELCRDIIRGRYIRDSSDFCPLVREFLCQIKCSFLRPVSIVSYDRTAFVEKNGNIRITFDRNISASHQTGRFLDGDAFFLPFPPERADVLEVKYDELLPHYIRQAVQMGSHRQITFSKYFISRHVLSCFGG